MVDTGKLPGMTFHLVPISRWCSCVHHQLTGLLVLSWEASALTSEGVYSISQCLQLISQTGTSAVVKPKPVRSGQQKTSIEALEQNFPIRLPDDHKQYDDGTSTASKLCVTVLFLQYLNQEVGCICFYERDCRLPAPLHHKLFKKKHNNNAEELLCYCLNVLLSLLFKKRDFFCTFTFADVKKIRVMVVLSWLCIIPLNGDSNLKKDTLCI